MTDRRVNEGKWPKKKKKKKERRDKGKVRVKDLLRAQAYAGKGNKHAGGFSVFGSDGPRRVARHDRLTDLRPLIRATPEEIVHLDAGGNPDLRRLPKKLAKLASLSELRLSDCGIEAIPHWFGDPDRCAFTSTLTSLLLPRNNLGSPTAFPPHFGSFACLETLFLSECMLDAVPPAVTRLVSLRKLHLKENSISHLPPGLSALQNLDTIQLAGNLLSTFPHCLTALPRLRTVFLHNNDLVYVTGDVTKLTSLTSLNLKGNPALRDVSAAFYSGLSLSELMKLLPLLTRAERVSQYFSVMEVLYYARS